MSRGLASGLAAGGDRNRRALTAVSLLLLAALAGVLLFYNLGAESLAGDETIYGLVAREAALGGGWVPLHFNGELLLNKPPLGIWMMAGAFRIFGGGEWSARCAAALLGVGTLLLVAGAGAALFDLRVGVVAALLLLGTHHFLFDHGLRQAVLEPALIFLMSSALLLYLAWRGGGAGIPGRRLGAGRLAAVGALLGAAFLVKSPVPFLALLIVAAWELLLPLAGPRRHRLREPLRMAAIAGAIYLPWPLMLLAATRGAYLGFLRQDLLERASGGLDPSHVRQGVYGHVLGVDFGWALLLLAAVPWVLVRSRRERRQEVGRICFLVLWALGMLGFFALPASKNEWYIYPAYPALAMLLALAAVRLYDWRLRPSRPLRAAAVAVLAAWLGAGLWRTWVECRRPVERTDSHRIARFLDGLGRADLCMEAGLDLREWDAYYLLPHVTRVVERGRGRDCAYLLAADPAPYLAPGLLPARARFVRRLNPGDPEVALVALRADLPAAIRSPWEGARSSLWSYVALRDGAAASEEAVRSRMWSAQERLRGALPAAGAAGPAGAAGAAGAATTRSGFPAPGVLLFQRYRRPEEAAGAPGAAGVPDTAGAPEIAGVPERSGRRPWVARPSFADGWLQGGEGTLLVAAGAGQGTLSLVLDSWHRQGTEQPLAITTRGGRTLRYALPGWRMVRLDVPIGPADVRPWPGRAEGWVPLEITAAAWQPHAVDPASPDTRRLGCRVLAVGYCGRLLARAAGVGAGALEAAVRWPPLGP